MRHLRPTALALLLFLPSLSTAQSFYGATVSVPLVTKDPDSLHGFQLMLNYDPQRFKWRQFNVYFDGGFSHFWVTNTPYYTNLNITRLHLSSVTPLKDADQYCPTWN